MIDEAFMPFSEIIKKMIPTETEYFDEEAGVHSYIYEASIESPMELDVQWDNNGQLQIGSVPPLYYVDTTFKPSYHRISFTAEKNEDNAD